MLLVLLPVCVLLALHQPHRLGGLARRQPARRTSGPRPGCPSRRPGSPTGWRRSAPRPRCCACGPALRLRPRSAPRSATWTGRCIRRGAPPWAGPGPWTSPAGSSQPTGSWRPCGFRLPAGHSPSPRISTSYGVIVNDLISTAGELVADRPLQTSGQAADAYVAILQAIEAAQRERADVATSLATPLDQAALYQMAAGSRWATLESAELGTFRQNASGRLARGPRGGVVHPGRDRRAEGARRDPHQSARGGRGHLPGGMAGCLGDPDRRPAAAGERSSQRPGRRCVARRPGGAGGRLPQPGPVARGAGRWSSPSAW